MKKVGPDTRSDETESLKSTRTEAEEVIGALDVLMGAIRLPAIPTAEAAAKLPPGTRERIEMARANALAEVRAELVRLRERYAELRQAGREGAQALKAMIERGPSIREVAAFGLARNQEAAEQEISWLYANILEFEALESELTGGAGAAMPSEPPTS